MIEFYEVAPASAVGQIKSVKVPQSGRKQLVFKLTDDAGRPVDLRREVENPPAGAPDFDPQPAATGINVTVRLATQQGEFYGPNQILLDGELMDEMGFVSFQLGTEKTQYAGAFSATIGQFAGENYLVNTWPVVIIIEPNAFAPICETNVLSIPDVRYAILDTQNGTGGAPFNNLLDDVEFTDAEIIFAMRRIIDKWNQTPPLVSPFSSSNFPFRYWWLQGTVAQLLLMGAARYRRNRLDYQAGGVAINDQSKAEEYETVGRATMAEFDQWMLRYKTSVNMEYCWGAGL